ncbi:hypothetical protein PHLCEN_2v10660, partial [Hermanssonia centrifuga]
ISSVDKFNSYRGSGTTAIFEAVWRSGDRTWVPYDAVKHLLAFNEFLAALGVGDAKDLPEGTGSPPPDDPQVFLGCMVLDPPSALIRPPYSSKSTHGRVCRDSRLHAVISRPPCALLFFRSHSPILLSLSLPTDLLATLVCLLMPYRHPRLSRRSDGALVLESKGCHYSYPLNELTTALFFDSQLREHRVQVDNTVMPGFYDGLALLWNSLDGCRFKLATFDAEAKQAIMAGPPIPRIEFIPTQFAHASSSMDASTSGTIITPDEQQHLLLMAAREKMRLDRRKFQGIADRQAKRALQPETRQPSSKASQRVRERIAEDRERRLSNPALAAPRDDDDELEDYPPDDEPMGEALTPAITAAVAASNMEDMVVSPLDVGKQGAKAGLKGKARG